MRILKLLGSLLILLSFFLYLGSVWGMVAERDFSLRYLPISVAGVGLILFALASSLQKKDVSSPKPPLWAQIISGLTVLVQLVMIIPVLNAILMLLVPLIKFSGTRSFAEGYSKGFTLESMLVFQVLPISLFVAAGFLRKKLRRTKHSS